MVSSTGAQTKDIGLSNCVLFQQQFNAAEHIRFFSFPPIGSASLCVSPRPPPPGAPWGRGPRRCEADGEQALGARRAAEAAEGDLAPGAWLPGRFNTTQTFRPYHQEGGPRQSVGFHS